MKLPNPLEIEFGTGRISIRRCRTDNEFGVMFVDSGKEREVGSYGKEPAENDHEPQQGEVYLSFTNKESCEVLIEELKKSCVEFFKKQEKSK